MLILLTPLQLMVKHGETGVSPTIHPAFSLDSIPLQAASIGATPATPATPRSPSGAVKPAPAAAAMAAEAAAMAEKWDLDGEKQLEIPPGTGKNMGSQWQIWEINGKYMEIFNGNLSIT